jgi:O-antigen/teichoic acid export membrane protein
MIQENPKITILIAYATYALGQLCFVTFNILIFRQFSLEEVGAYGLIISIVVFAGFALDLGITQTLVRGFSQNALTLSQAVTAAMTLRLPILALGLVAFLVWRYLDPSRSAAEAPPLLLAVLSQFLISLRAIATSWLRGHDRQNLGNVLNLLQPIGYLAVSLTLLSLQHFRLFPLFAGVLLVELVIIGLAFLVVKRVPMPAAINRSLALVDMRAALAAIWKPSLIFFVVSFWATIQSRLDWIMVYSLGSKTELAYYSLANKVYELLESGLAVFINTVFPWMCKMILSQEKNPRMIIGFKGIIFVGAVLAVATALWLPGLLTVLWGDKFAKANDLIVLLMCGACVNTVCSMMYYLLIAAGKEKYLLITSTVPALCQIGANIMLIPKYGSYGATLSMLVLIFTSYMLLSMICLKHRLGEYIGLVKNTLILFWLIAALLLFGDFLKQSNIHAALFLIASVLTGSLTLFSHQERSLVFADLRAIFTSSSPKVGKDL